MTLQTLAQHIIALGLDKHRDDGGLYWALWDKQEVWVEFLGHDDLPREESGCYVGERSQDTHSRARQIVALLRNPVARLELADGKPPPFPLPPPPAAHKKPATRKRAS